MPWIEPEAIAHAVVFLASDEAAMVSVATIDVTGGDSANNTWCWKITKHGTNETGKFNFIITLNH